jgi:diadenylate cyclase
VAFLIYRLLLLAKGTRAYQVLIGLLVFVLALYLSDALGLETIHWLLDRMTTLGPVALVILFFPELRRVLETIGRVEFWRSSWAWGRTPRRFSKPSTRWSARCSRWRAIGLAH